MQTALLRNVHTYSTVSFVARRTGDREQKYLMKISMCVCVCVKIVSLEFSRVGNVLKCSKTKN